MQDNIINQDRILQQATETRVANKSKKENQGSQTSGSAEIVAETMKHENVPRTAKNVTDDRRKITSGKCVAQIQNKVENHTKKSK